MIIWSDLYKSWYFSSDFQAIHKVCRPLNNPWLSNLLPLEVQIPGNDMASHIHNITDSWINAFKISSYLKVFSRIFKKSDLMPFMNFAKQDKDIWLLFRIIKDDSGQTKFYSK